MVLPGRKPAIHNLCHHWYFRQKSIPSPARRGSGGTPRAYASSIQAENAAVSLCKFAQILAVTLALSAYGAWLRGQRSEHTAGQGETPMVGGILLYRLAEVEAIWHDPTTRFVDSRWFYEYEVGHIAGALSLPQNDFDQRFPSLRPQLEKAKTIVVYCSKADCASSLRVAIRLREEGLGQTQIYPAGWDEWFNRGLPIQRTATR